MFVGLIAALFLALIVTSLAVAAFRRRGPWGSAWTFFLFMFLALWTSTIYVRHIGPVYYGIAWMPLFFLAIILSVLLIVPGANEWRDESIKDNTPAKDQPPRRTEAPAPPARTLFWVITFLLIVAIILGMTNPQWAL
jgi:hypothetical protein